MYLNIDELLQKKEKSRFWLSQQTGITYPNLAKMTNNKTSSIRFEFIDKLCNILDCTPNELFVKNKPILKK
jgi:putative transcriptional regulator